jgi:hypothetical protein
VKAGLEGTQATLLVIVGGLRDGRKVVLATGSGPRESKESWARVLRDLFRALDTWGIWWALGDAARRYKKVANAEALIWKILMVAEKKFRRLNSPELPRQFTTDNYSKTACQCTKLTRSPAPPDLVFTPIAVTSGLPAFTYRRINFSTGFRIATNTRSHQLTVIGRMPKRCAIAVCVRPIASRASLNCSEVTIHIGHVA